MAFILEFGVWKFGLCGLSKGEVSFSMESPSDRAAFYTRNLQGHTHFACASSKRGWRVKQLREREREMRIVEPPLKVD